MAKLGGKQRQAVERQWEAVQRGIDALSSNQKITLWEATKIRENQEANHEKKKSGRFG